MEAEATEHARSMKTLPLAVGRAIRLTFRASPSAFIVSALLNVLTALAGLGQLAIARDALGSLLANRRTVPHMWLDLTGLFVTTVVLYASIGLATGRSRILAEESVRLAQADVLRSAIAVDLVEFDRPAFYDRLTRALRQSYTVLNVALGCTGLLTGTLGALGYAVGLLFIQPLLVPLVVFGYLPLFIAASRTSSELFDFNFGATPDDRARSRLQELLVSRNVAAELRLLNAGSSLLDRWDELFDTRLIGIRKVVSASDRRYVLSGIAAATMVAGTYGVLAAMFVHGWLNGAAAATAAIAMQQLGSRLAAAATALSGIADNAYFFDDFRAFTSPPTAALTDAIADPAVPPLSVLRVDNVTFSYPESKQKALRRVTLEIRAGEVIAIVGENGSGKSTLAKIIAGLYAVEDGRVMWNDLSYAGSPSDVRRGVAALPQEFGRFPFSVADNIALGDAARSRSDTDVAWAGRAAGAASFVSRQRKKYDALLGREFDGGTELSGGEWQRIALARAFYKRDAQLLILDEPSAALDPRAEAELFTRLRSLCEGKTVVYISHRFSTVADADRIVVMHKGRIVECGDHASLMRAGGRYRDLYTLQRSQFDRADALA